MKKPKGGGAKISEKGTDRRGLERLDGVPLHRQLFLVLRSAVYSGRYNANESFPTEEALVRSFNVSRTTVRRALSSLEGEGLIDRKQGAGTRVTADVATYTIETSLADHRKNVESVASLSGLSSMLVDTVPASDAVASALKISPGTNLMRIRRVRLIDDLPVWYTVAYFPPEVRLSLHGGDQIGANFLSLLENSGIIVGEVDETIGAVLAEPEAADQLKVGIGAPLLENIVTVVDDAGNPVSLQITMVPPERRRIRLARRSGVESFEE